jgi:hypothetical protein
MTVKELSETADLSAAARALVKEDSTPSAYLESLEQQQLFQDAIKFQTYKLSTDSGIKWAIACIKELRSPESKQQKDEPLDAADQWVKFPGDPTRWAAKKASDKTEKNGPSNLVAMAVFFSGGSMAPPGAPETPPPQYAAQKFISGSVLVTVVSHEPKKANERYQQALKMGKALDTPGA